MNTDQTETRPDNHRLPAADCSADLSLRNELAGIPMEDGFMSDNLAIALATYFEGHMDCPDEEIDGELGWKPWAMSKTDSVLDRIVQFIRQNKEFAHPCQGLSPMKAAVVRDTCPDENLPGI